MNKFLKNVFLMLALWFQGCAAAQECHLSVGSSGYLKVDGTRVYEIFELEKFGVTVSEPMVLPTPNEGEMWRKEVLVDDRLCLYFEYDKKGFERFVIKDSSIPVQTQQGLSIHVGDALDELAKLGELNENFGEEPGMYMSISGINNLSFHTQCSILPFEMTAKQKEMTRGEFLATCRIDKILVWRTAN